MNRILRFKTDTKHRKDWFTGISFSHPAKLSLPLQLWLIDNFTEPGETILDPMAGSGTVLVACSLGRHVIAVELEPKFCDMMKGNWEKIKQRGPQLGYTMGEALILQGDARNLTGILADRIVTSPPYAGEAKGISQSEYDKKQAIVNEARLRRGDIKGGIGRSGALGKSVINPNGYSKDPDNIGNLPYGSIDAVIDLHNGQIDDIIKSNGQILQGMREATDTKGTGEGTPVSLSQKAILQSELPSQPSQSVDQNQTERPSTSNNECRNTPPMADRKLCEWQTGTESSSRTFGIEPATGSQDFEASRNTSEVKRKRRRTSSELAGRMEEISGSELADTAQESTGEGQLPVSDMPRANRPSSSPDTLPDKQGQQLDQSIGFMCSVSRQSNRSNPQSSPQDNPQALQTPIDCVISSPSYEQSLDRWAGDNHNKLMEDKGLHMPKIDAVISSPPYEGSDVSQTHMTSDQRGDPTNPNYRPSWKRKLAEGYADTKRPYVDSIITSPPYENNPGTPSLGSVNKDNWGKEGTDIVKRRGLEKGYNQTNEAQIGNLKSTDYLSAMAQVYAQCYHSLKPRGIMVLVTKNFIREQKIVRLDLDTIQICEQAGFIFQERWYRELLAQSFWRIIYKRKYPDAPQLKYEDILVFSKQDK